MLAFKHDFLHHWFKKAQIEFLHKEMKFMYQHLLTLKLSLQMA